MEETHDNKKNNLFCELFTDEPKPKNPMGDMAIQGNDCAKWEQEMGEKEEEGIISKHIGWMLVSIAQISLK